jgi:transposase-like protein
MKRSRYTEEQIIAVLREHEAGAKTADLCRTYGMSEATLYNWKAKFGGMDVSDAKRLRALEGENAKLKKLLAESMLDASALRELLTKNGKAGRQARGCRSSANGVPDERTAGLLRHRCRSH